MDFPDFYSESFNWVFQTFQTKESSLQIFPTDLFVKGAYYVVKILDKYNALFRNNRLLIWNSFYFTFQEKHVFCKII